MSTSFTDIARRTFLNRGIAFAVVGVLWVVGCAGEGDTPSRPITAKDLRAVALHGLTIAEGTISLSSGRWEGMPYVEGGASRPFVQLVEDIVRTGDVTGDGADDAIAFVAESGGGSGSILYLILVERDGSGVKNTATVSIGDRAQIRSAAIDNGAVTVELVQHADTDPMCCTGDLVKRSISENMPID